MTSVRCEQTQDSNGTLTTRKITTLENGNVISKIHSDDGPAVVHLNGDQEWWVEGDKIKTIENGCTTWYEKGKVSRVGDLPAIIRANGDQEWWMGGIRCREDDKPSIVRANGDQEWWRGDERYRAGDKPSIVRANGDQEWWLDDERYRADDKPAIVRANGDQEWWAMEWMKQVK